MKSCRERDPGSSAYENNKRDKDERAATVSAQLKS